MAQLYVEVTANIRVKIGESKCGVDVDDFDDYSEYKDAIEDEATTAANQIVEELANAHDNIVKVEVDESEVDFIEGRLQFSSDGDDDESEED